MIVPQLRQMNSSLLRNHASDFLVLVPQFEQGTSISRGGGGTFDI
jgi:hypothetical protein